MALTVMEQVALFSPESKLPLPFSSAKAVIVVVPAATPETTPLDTEATSSYGKYENSDFIVTCGGGNSSVGINNNSSNWSKFNLSSYSKYAVSPITTSDYATAVVMKKSTADVVNMTFAYTAGTNANKGHIYAIYSSDNTTFPAQPASPWQREKS